MPNKSPKAADDGISKAAAPKRSLTPRRRAREYALQGVYQWLVMRRAGSLGNAAAISKQLAEDPAFARCKLDLFEGLFKGVLDHADQLDSVIAPALDRPANELSPVEHAALLIGAYELAMDMSVPYKVAINEAVELAKPLVARTAISTSMACLIYWRSRSEPPRRKRARAQSP
jgi:transcription antitermination protein NusB